MLVFLTFETGFLGLTPSRDAPLGTVGLGPEVAGPWSSSTGIRTESQTRLGLIYQVQFKETPIRVRSAYPAPDGVFPSRFMGLLTLPVHSVTRDGVEFGDSFPNIYRLPIFEIISIALRRVDRRIHDPTIGSRVSAFMQTRGVAKYHGARPAGADLDIVFRHGIVYSAFGWIYAPPSELFLREQLSPMPATVGFHEI